MFAMKKVRSYAIDCPKFHSNNFGANVFQVVHYWVHLQYTFWCASRVLFRLFRRIRRIRISSMKQTLKRCMIPHMNSLGGTVLNFFPSISKKTLWRNFDPRRFPSPKSNISEISLSILSNKVPNDNWSLELSISGIFFYMKSI